ncbi:hypothetical protein DMENIID0001_171510 [Sergentomyia squamirostris]
MKWILVLICVVWVYCVDSTNQQTYEIKIPDMLLKLLPPDQKQILSNLKAKNLLITVDGVGGQLGLTKDQVKKVNDAMSQIEKEITRILPSLVGTAVSKSIGG